MILTEHDLDKLQFLLTTFKFWGVEAHPGESSFLVLPDSFVSLPTEEVPVSFVSLVSRLQETEALGRAIPVLTVPDIFLGKQEDVKHFLSASVCWPVLSTLHAPGHSNPKR